ncbi:MAG: glycosyltransferase family 9 protein [Candidatus Eisenbacteria bacterium]|nr:glycosyltransferase family 9 protein [Candidatus Eisenbacteria bacterium]
MDLLDLLLRYRRVRSRRRVSSEPIAVQDTLRKPERIAVLLGGDPRLPPLVLPSLRLIRERHPGVKLLLVGGPENVPVFRRDGIADKALAISPKRGTARIGEIRRTGRAIAEHDPRILLLLDAPPDPTLLAVALESGAPIRLGFGRGDHAPFLNFEVAPPEGETYLAQSLLKMVGAVTGCFLGFLDDRVRWKVPEADARRAERLIHFWQPRSDRLLVAIEPGAEEPGREPDMEKYVAIARLLSRAYGARVLIVSSPEERHRAEELERRLDFLEPYRAQTDDLAQAVAFLSRSDLVVSSNTPLFHYSVAVGIPTVGLFPEKTDPRFLPPAGAPAVIIPLHKEITEEGFLRAVETLAGDGVDAEP